MSGGLAGNVPAIAVVSAVAVAVAVAVVVITVWRDAARRRRLDSGPESVSAQLVDGRRLLADRLEESGTAGSLSRDRALLLAYFHGGTAVPGAVNGGREASVRRLVRELGDEFGHRDVYRLTSQQIAIVSDDSAETSARGNAKRILAATAAQPAVGPVSVGGAVRAAGSPPLQLWADADAALRVASGRGAGSVILHSDVGDGAPAVTSAELDRLHELLDEERFAITFQPVVSLDSQKLLGFEALSRPASHYGFEGLSHAFAAATQLGRAAELDAACRAAVLDEGPGFDMPPGSLLFVNLSAAGLGHPSLQPGPLLSAVRDAGLTRHRVVFELSEPAAVDPDFVAKRAKDLIALGFKVALGGLGVGAAGFEWLRRIPADFLKLDSVLLTSSATDPLAEGLVHAICLMGQRTGATVIAEGVETEELLDLAQRLPGPPTGPQVRAAQGSLIGPWDSRPLDRRSHAKAASA